MGFFTDLANKHIANTGNDDIPVVTKAVKTVPEKTEHVETDAPVRKEIVSPTRPENLDFFETPDIKKHLRSFWQIGDMLEEMGHGGIDIAHVDESEYYFIVFIPIKLNVDDRVLENKNKMSRIALFMQGVNAESYIFIDKALHNGSPHHIVGFPKKEKSKLHLNSIERPADLKHMELPIALCQRVDKTIYWECARKMGHTAIEGGSGSGKTTQMHSIICQLMTNPSAELYLIDMKGSARDWGRIADCLPETNKASTFSGAIRVLDNVIQKTNFRRESEDNAPIILVLEEADKMMNSGFIDDVNPIDKNYPSKAQHDAIRQRMGIVATELRSLGVIAYWMGQGTLSSLLGSHIKNQFMSLIGMKVRNHQCSLNATGQAQQHLHMLSGKGDMQVYVDGTRVRGNGLYCTQDDVVSVLKAHPLYSVEERHVCV